MVDEKDLREMYVDRDLSQRELARHFQCSQTNIRHWLLKYGIQKNQKHTYSETGVKTCPACNKTKPLAEFYKRTGDTPGSWCKSCMHRQIVIRQQDYKKQAVAYKGGKCVVCGFAIYQGALEFHHLDPAQKDVQMSKHTREPLSPEGKAELDKCVLVCANCHRMIHGKLIIFDAKGRLVQSPFC